MEFEIGLKKYCVYHHKIKGKIFYVGCGTIGRALSTFSRNIDWWEMVNSNKGKYTVEFIKFFKEKTDALAFEKKEILKQDPHANGRWFSRKMQIESKTKF